MWPLLLLLIVDALLLIAAVVVPVLPFTAVADIVAGLGVVALAAGVLWQRPAPMVAWSLIIAGGAVALAVMGEVNWTGGGLILPGDWLLAVLSGLSLAFFVGGLAMLGQLSMGVDALDALDATVIALATFLVLFALAIHPVVRGDGAALATAIVLPVGALLMLAMAVRVVFALGIPTVAVGLILLASCAFVGAVVGVLVPSLTGSPSPPNAATRGLWVMYGLLLGAGGLHPSLRQTRRRRRRGDALSGRRTILLVILAVIAPVAWGAEIRRAAQLDDAPIGFGIPIAVSATLLVLLVWRLALTARVAQRRSDDLAHRSEELAEAVEEQAALQRQLRYQAMHDPLTGLSNRLVLSERMEWALTRRDGARQHAVALLDLDGFKDVNDTLGHPIGDELLIEAAHRLLETMPDGSTLARLGGDEFAVLLEDTPPREALGWAEHARQTLHRPYHVEHQEVFLSSSVGLLTIEAAAPKPTPSDALRDADLALYAAKAAGKNQVVVFRPEFRAARADMSRLSAGLRHALDRNELALEYQPVVDLATRRIVAVEALMRWTPAGGPAVPPTQFIPVAEDSGMIGPIGDWAIRRACRDVKRWHLRYGIAVAVNVSARQIDDPEFSQRVLDTLADADLPGEALIIEVTESSLVATSTASAAMRQLERLREHRIRIAIDDFGTGYSSLSYVARLPADIVKIDRSFVPDSSAAADAESWALTRSILQLVRSLRLEAVAEGVETLQQAESLRQFQCRLAQGYLFAKPMPKEILDQILSISDTMADDHPLG